jgi:DNA mismatch repair ATPase MutS
VITTHFGDAFDYNLLMDDQHEVCFYQMEVLLKDKHGGDPTQIDIDEVVPVFHLVPGKCTSSFGLSCARQAGVPMDVLLRAKEVRTIGSYVQPHTSGGEPQGHSASGWAPLCPPRTHAEPTSSSHLRV